MDKEWLKRIKCLLCEAGFSTVILTDEGRLVIDTIPRETDAVKAFLTERWIVCQVRMLR